MKTRHKNWQLRNDDSHTIELTWRIPNHCRNSRKQLDYDNSSLAVERMRDNILVTNYQMNEQSRQITSR